MNAGYIKMRPQRLVLTDECGPGHSKQPHCSGGPLMSAVPVEAAALAIESFSEPLELVKALIDSEIGIGDGLLSKIHKYLLDDMQMLAADDVILLQLPVKELVALQKDRVDLKKDIVQAWANERISQSQARTLIQLLCLEAA